MFATWFFIPELMWRRGFLVFVTQNLLEKWLILNATKVFMQKLCISLINCGDLKPISCMKEFPQSENFWNST